MAAEERAASDWQPWGVLALLGAATTALVLVPHGDRTALAKRTVGSGEPLAAEQQSVAFRTADLAIEVFPNRRAIQGKAVLGFAVQKRIAKIQFDLDPELPIRAIAADGRTLDAKAWRNDGGLVTVNLPAAKRAGDSLSLAVEYGGRPHVAKRAPWDGGFVWSRTKDGKPWIATAVEGEGCDLFWPCFDNSLVEVGQVDLHITVPKGLSAPSNGRLLSVTEAKDGRRTFNWRTRNPNNYAIALNIAPYKELSAVHRSRFGNLIPINYWYLPGEDDKAKALFAEFGPTLDTFEALVGPYPFGGEKLGVVETPHLGMEHQTINAYGNAYKLAPEGFDWLFNHEFSHEWFGNQMTNRDWDDMWLHEGFGTYMQPLYLQQRGGQMLYDAAMFKQRQTISNVHPVVSGTHQLEEQVYKPETGPGGDIYVKGSWVLHSLRGLIGDEAFFRSLRRLVYGRVDPAPGNFTTRFGSTNEFVAITSQESGRDLRWFFNAYLRHARLPKLVETRQGQTLSLQWQTPGGIPFPMPVDVRIDGKTMTVPMDKGRGSVGLPTATSNWTVDPDNKLLRQNDAIDRFRDWTAAQKKKA